MLNRVSGVSFGEKLPVGAKADINAPQSQTRPNAYGPQEEPKKKSHKFLKTVVGLAIAAAAVAGLLVLGAKGGEAGSWFSKVAEKSSKDWVKKSAEWAEGAGNTIKAWAKSGSETVKGWFKRAESEAVGEGTPPQVEVPAEELTSAAPGVPLE